MRILLESGESLQSNAEGLMIVPGGGVELHTNVQNLAVLGTGFRGGQNTGKYGTSCDNKQQGVVRWPTKRK